MSGFDWRGSAVSLAVPAPRRLRKLERCLVALVMLVPVPLLALSGIGLPLPGVVGRGLASILPEQQPAPIIRPVATDHSAGTTTRSRRSETAGGTSVSGSASGTGGSVDVTGPGDTSTGVSAGSSDNGSITVGVNAPGGVSPSVGISPPAGGSVPSVTVGGPP